MTAALAAVQHMRSQKTPADENTPFDLVPEMVQSARLPAAAVAAGYMDSGTCCWPPGWLAQWCTLGVGAAVDCTSPHFGMAGYLWTVGSARGRHKVVSDLVWAALKGQVWDVKVSDQMATEITSAYSHFLWGMSIHTTNGFVNFSPVMNGCCRAC